MKLVAGEIYFIGEREHDTGQITPFYKIGIVRENEGRTSEERRKEHQTGNPRPLFIHQTVKAHAVERVETLLHRRFAQHRGAGEWFKFDADLLETAISAAHNLSADTEKYIHLFAQADELAEQVSSDTTIDPTEDAVSWFNKYHAALVISKTFADLDDEIRTLLREAVARGETPRGVRQQKIKYTEYFNKARFETEQFEFYQRYLVTSQTLVKRFLVKKPTDTEIIEQNLYAELLAVADDIRTQIQEVRDGQRSKDELQPLSLVISESTASAGWDKEVAEMHLRVATGTNEGIDRICTWKRKMEDKTSFDENAFKGENFEIYKQFIDLKQTGGNILIDPGQAAAD